MMVKRAHGFAILALPVLGLFPAVGGTEPEGGPPVIPEASEEPGGGTEGGAGLTEVSSGVDVLHRDEASEFEPQRARFQVQVSDVTVPYRVMAVSVLPGESVQVSVVSGEEATASLEPGWEAVDHRGPVEPTDPGHWTWRAPSEPGAYPVRVRSQALADSVHLNVLVLHPRTWVQEGYLDDFQIGGYRTGQDGPPPPDGFFEVGPEEEEILASPHFVLGQFLSNQGGSPSYLALSEPLVLKLEAVLEAVNEEGISAPTLHVMSGFRTPAYNRAIGNRTELSRHLWGDAADIFIDTTGDGRMDDLNGDGRVDWRDAELLYRIVESVEEAGEVHIHPGGLAVYRENAVRGPFVHVDARGRPARW